jgi:hypothetical protein
MIASIAPINLKLSNLRQIVAQSGPAGMGMAALEQALVACGQPMPRRTILRRLGDLIDQGVVDLPRFHGQFRDS